MLKFILLFYVFSNFLKINAISDLNCIHDEISNRHQISQKNISAFEKRFRQSDRLYDTPIRIHLDTSNLKSLGKERELIISIMSKKQKNNLKKSTDIPIKIYIFILFSSLKRYRSNFFQEDYEL